MRVIRYKLCPRCRYAFKASLSGNYCIHCGQKLLKHCPECRGPINNFLADHCPLCGYRYDRAVNPSPASDAGNH